MAARIALGGPAAGLVPAGSRDCGAAGLLASAQWVDRTPGSAYPTHAEALLQMNVQLTQAVKDITGVTGLAIIRAIVAGERDPQRLAALRQPGVKQTAEQIARALTGHYRPEHLFALKQAWPCTTSTVSRLPSAIGRSRTSCPSQVQPRRPTTCRHWTPVTNGTQEQERSQIRARSLLYRWAGVDLVAIPA